MSRRRGPTMCYPVRLGTTAGTMGAAACSGPRTESRRAIRAEQANAEWQTGSGCVWRPVGGTVLLAHRHDVVMPFTAHGYKYCARPSGPSHRPCLRRSSVPIQIRAVTITSTISVLVLSAPLKPSLRICEPHVHLSHHSSYFRSYKYDSTWVPNSWQQGRWAPTAKRYLHPYPFI